MAIYVNLNASGSGDGSSWDNAFTNLQLALASATTADEIWVAQGVYKPGENRTDSFQLKDGVTIYGGFGGEETALEQRDIKNNLTYLSGDIGTERNNSDNSYTVVKLNSGTATLDGFIIQDGNNTQSDDDLDDGGGVYNNGDLTLRNVVVRYNQAADDGGGIRNNGTITIIDSEITYNTSIGTSSTSGGGGLINTGDSATIINTTFTNNSAKNGGAIRNDTNLTLTNSTLSGNTAYESGGGLVNTINPLILALSSDDNVTGTAQVTITNSIITKNTALDSSQSGSAVGSGIANFAIANISDSIIAGNGNADDLADNFTAFGKTVIGNNTSGGNNSIGNGDGVSGFTDGSNGDKVGAKYNRINLTLNETFDNDSQFKKSTKFFSDGSDDYFGISGGDGGSDYGKGNPPPNIKAYTGFTNSFLTGQDLDGEGASLPITLNWSNLDIKWLTNLQFSGDFAQFFDSPGDIDAPDSIKLYYSIDDGQEQNLLWFSGTDFNNNSSNGVFSQDTNFDGVGDGTELGDAVQNFSTAIAGTGSRLDLKLEISLNAGNEDFAIDNFLITGITAPIEGDEAKDNLIGTSSHDQINGFAGKRLPQRGTRR